MQELGDLKNYLMMISEIVLKFFCDPPPILSESEVKFGLTYYKVS
jgi:hypothetical protein